MRTALAATIAAATLLVAGCSGDDDPTATATDPATSDPSGSPAGPTPPAAVPAADGTVRSRTLPTVMDTGDGPELCLGAIAESYPPQCSGPEIEGWDWEKYGDTADRQGDVRWGAYAVTGTWDGTTFTVTDAIPAALYDPLPGEPAVLPDPTVDHSDAELTAISDGLVDELPGYLSSAPDSDGHVLVDVVYDDGSLQSYVDEAYGAGVVVVSGALVDGETVTE